jgi:hypothetical protein
MSNWVGRGRTTNNQHPTVGNTSLRAKDGLTKAAQLEEKPDLKIPNANLIEICQHYAHEYDMDDGPDFIGQWLAGFTDWRLDDYFSICAPFH